MLIDFGDEAQLRSEQHLAESLARRSTLTVPFSGKCMTCEEPVGQRRFCGPECREEFSQKQKLKFSTRA